MDLVAVIQKLYPTAILFTDFVIADHGFGPQIEYWNKEVLGDEPSQEFLLQTWNDGMHLSSVVNNKIKEFNIITMERVAGGFVSNAVGEDYFYSTANTNENRGQLNLTAATLSATLHINEIGWLFPIWCVKMSNNSNVFLPHTAHQILKVAADGKNKILEYQQRLDDSIKALNSCTTIEEVELVSL